MGITDYLTWLLRNLSEGQETTIRLMYKTPDWFRIEKGVWKGCLLSPCLFNLYAELIVRNARLDDLQAGIRIVGRNNNLRYADDTTLMTESEENYFHRKKRKWLKNLLMRVKEESEKAGLKLNIKKKTKIMVSGPIKSWQIEGGKGGSSDRFPLIGL